MSARLQTALDRIDSINSEDPRRESGQPTEQIYSARMSSRLASFAPDASELLRIAVHAQHVARWRLPRDNFDSGRAGYKLWRSTLARMHADVAAEVLDDCGYGPSDIDRVRDLLTKKGIKRDAEVQTLEDVACLVFLDHYFVDFAHKHGYDRDKLVDIVRKTWKKMSERGQAAALAIAGSLPADLLSAVQEAIA